MKAREPILNVPGAISGVLVLIILLHIMRQVLSETQEEWFILAMAFIPARYDGIAADLPGGEWAMLTSPITHMLVHGDAMHLVLNSAWLLAFGSAIGRRVGNIRFLLFSVFCGLCGALAFYAVHARELVPVVGASGALSGLMAATLRYLLSAIDGGGLVQLREKPQEIVITPLTVAIRDRRLIWATAIWLMLNAMAIYGIGSVRPEGGIAWEAHVGGFIAGLVGLGLFDINRPSSSQSHNKPTLH